MNKDQNENAQNSTIKSTILELLNEKKPIDYSELLSKYVISKNELYRTIKEILTLKANQGENNDSSSDSSLLFPGLSFECDMDCDSKSSAECHQHCSILLSPECHEHCNKEQIIKCHSHCMELKTVFCHDHCLDLKSKDCHDHCDMSTSISSHHHYPKDPIDQFHLKHAGVIDSELLSEEDQSLHSNVFYNNSNLETLVDVENEKDTDGTGESGEQSKDNDSSASESDSENDNDSSASESDSENDNDSSASESDSENDNEALANLRTDLIIFDLEYDPKKRKGLEKALHSKICSKHNIGLKYAVDNHTRKVFSCVCARPRIRNPDTNKIPRLLHCDFKVSFKVENEKWTFDRIKSVLKHSKECNGSVFHGEFLLKFCEIFDKDIKMEYFAGKNFTEIKTFTLKLMKKRYPHLSQQISLHTSTISKKLRYMISNFPPKIPVEVKDQKVWKFFLEASSRLDTICYDIREPNKISNVFVGYSDAIKLFKTHKLKTVSIRTQHLKSCERSKVCTVLAVDSIGMMFPILTGYLIDTDVKSYENLLRSLYVCLMHDGPTLKNLTEVQQKCSDVYLFQKSGIVLDQILSSFCKNLIDAAYSVGLLKDPTEFNLEAIYKYKFKKTMTSDEDDLLEMFEVGDGVDADFSHVNWKICSNESSMNQMLMIAPIVKKYSDNKQPLENGEQEQGAMLDMSLSIETEKQYITETLMALESFQSQTFFVSGVSSFHSFDKSGLSEDIDYCCSIDDSFLTDSANDTDENRDTVVSDNETTNNNGRRKFNVNLFEETQFDSIAKCIEQYEFIYIKIFKQHTPVSYVFPQDVHKVHYGVLARVLRSIMDSPSVEYCCEATVSIIFFLVYHQKGNQIYTYLKQNILHPKYMYLYCFYLADLFKLRLKNSGGNKNFENQVLVFEKSKHAIDKTSLFHSYTYHANQSTMCFAKNFDISIGFTSDGEVSLMEMYKTFKKKTQDLVKISEKEYANKGNKLILKKEKELMENFSNIHPNLRNTLLQLIANAKDLFRKELQEVFSAQNRPPVFKLGVEKLREEVLSVKKYISSICHGSCHVSGFPCIHTIIKNHLDISAVQKTEKSFKISWVVLGPILRDQVKFITQNITSIDKGKDVSSDSAALYRRLKKTIEYELGVDTCRLDCFPSNISSEAKKLDTFRKSLLLDLTQQKNKDVTDLFDTWNKYVS